MRVAALCDIHGNLPALETVLQAVRLTEAELIVVGGDIVPGPMPREVLECLLSLGIPVRFSSATTFRGEHASSIQPRRTEVGATSNLSLHSEQNLLTVIIQYRRRFRL